MSTKEILRGSIAKTKNHFWIYIAACAICFVVSGFADGSAEIFSALNRMLYALRSGSFSYSSMTDINSDFWAIMTAGGGVFRTIGSFGFLISIFIVNPLTVGLCGMFVSEEPSINSLFDIFKKDYMQVVKTTFVSNLLLTLITAIIATMYLTGCLVTVGLFAVAAENAESVLFPAIAATAAGVVMMAVYLVVTAYITYNFMMINYILAENPKCGFSESYAMSRRMVKNKKMKIFLVDLSISVWAVAAICVPAALIIAGIAINIAGGSGISCIILGMFLIIPSVLINVFVSVFENAAHAEIYKALKPKDEYKNKAEFISGEYRSFEEEDSVSYLKKEE